MGEMLESAGHGFAKFLDPTLDYPEPSGKDVVDIIEHTWNTIRLKMFYTRQKLPFPSVPVRRLRYCKNGRQDLLTLSSDRFFTASSTVSEKNIHWWLP